MLTPWLRVVNISRVIDWLWNLHRSSYFLSDSTELLGKVKQSYYQRIVQWQYFLQQEGSGRWMVENHSPAVCRGSWKIVYMWEGGRGRGGRGEGGGKGEGGGRGRGRSGGHWRFVCVGRGKEYF